MSHKIVTDHPLHLAPTRRDHHIDYYNQRLDHRLYRQQDTLTPFPILEHNLHIFKIRRMRIPPRGAEYSSLFWPGNAVARETHITLYLVDADGGEGMHLRGTEVGRGVGADMQRPAVKSDGGDTKRSGRPFGGAVEGRRVTISSNWVGKVSGHNGESLFVGRNAFLNSYDV